VLELVVVVMVVEVGFLAVEIVELETILEMFVVVLVVLL
jgi:hypothetical protein